MIIIPKKAVKRLTAALGAIAAPAGERHSAARALASRQSTAAAALRLFSQAAATPAPIFLVEGEHFEVPGLIRKVCLNEGAANAEAASMVNLLLQDCDLEETATARNWRGRLRAVHRHRGCVEGPDCNVSLFRLVLSDKAQPHDSD